MKRWSQYRAVLLPTVLLTLLMLGFAWYATGVVDRDRSVGVPCQPGVLFESCFATRSRRGSDGSFQRSASVRSSSHISFSGLRLR